MRWGRRTLSALATSSRARTVPGSCIWLRVSADIRPGAARGTFSRNIDGITFTCLGPDFFTGSNWRLFTGYRFALFNHATPALGGSVRLTRFELSTP